MAAKTYYVGARSLVKRGDNLNSASGSWTDLTTSFILGGGSPVYGDNCDLRDVMTDPFNSDKVFVVGGITPGFSFRGIAYSTDAGVTWQTPIYGPTLTTEISTFTPFVFYEVWCVDSNTIYAAGSNGIVAKSTDGGLNFEATTANIPQTLLSGANRPEVHSIHFINANDGVVGVDSFIFKTIDGGTTWSQLGGGIIGGVGAIVGIYMHTDQQTIVGLGESGITRSDNTGASFATIFNWNNRNGRHLTWHTAAGGFPILWGTGSDNQIVKSIATSANDIGATWFQLQSYIPCSTPPQVCCPKNDFRAAHFYTINNGFWAQSDCDTSAPNCLIYKLDGANLSISDDPNTSTGVFPSVNAIWTAYSPASCYILTDCTNPANVVETSTNLQAYLGIVITATIDEVPSNTCWLVSVGGDCSSSSTISDITSYVDCTSCESRCYKLTNCENPEDFLIVYAAYEDYLYKAVNIEGCPDKCYYVTRSDCSGAQPLTDLVITEYTTCAECLLTPPVYELKSRRVKPGYYTPGCPPEYTEKIYCTLAEAYYEQMAKDRFGIDICCDIDLDKWEIKRELLDLEALYDKDMCTYDITPCVEPCNLSATILVYQLITYIDNPPPADCVDPEPDPSVNTTFE